MGWKLQQKDKCRETERQALQRWHFAHTTLKSGQTEVKHDQASVEIKPSFCVCVYFPKKDLNIFTV